MAPGPLPALPPTDTRRPPAPALTARPALRAERGEDLQRERTGELSSGRSHLTGGKANGPNPGESSNVGPPSRGRALACPGGDRDRDPPLPVTARFPGESCGPCLAPVPP